MAVDDQNLQEKVIAGDRAAFRALYCHYRDLLYRLALARLCRPDLAEDAVQNVFRTLLKTLRGGAVVENLEHYLLRAVRLNAKDLSGRERRHEGYRRADAAKSAEPPDQRALNAERRERILAAVAALPEAQREAVVLHLADGLSFEAMSRLLDTPATTLQTRCAAGLQALRATLKED